MTQLQHPPIKFDPSFETIPDDEAELQAALTEAMLSIQRKTFADTGYAHRAVHAKAHGYLRATFDVLPDLPEALAQGLFARAASYDAVLRFSTTPATFSTTASRRRVAPPLRSLASPGLACPEAKARRPRTTCLAIRRRSRSAPLKAFFAS